MQLCDTDFHPDQADLWMIALVLPANSPVHYEGLYTEFFSKSNIHTATRNPQAAMIFPSEAEAMAKLRSCGETSPYPLVAVQIKDIMRIAVKITQIVDGFPTIKVVKYWKPIKEELYHSDEFTDMEKAKAHLQILKKDYIHFYQDKMIEVGSIQI